MARSPKSAPRLLVTERAQAVWLENTRIFAQDGRLVGQSKRGEGVLTTAPLPHANLSVIFLGQGCAISHEAAVLLSAEEVHLAFVGAGPEAPHFGSLRPFGNTSHFRNVAALMGPPDDGLRLLKALTSCSCDVMRDTGLGLIDDVLRRDNLRPFEKAIRTLETGIARANDREALKALVSQFSQSLRGAIGVDKEDLETIGRRGAQGVKILDGFAAAALWSLGVPPQLRLQPGWDALSHELAGVFHAAYVMPFAHADLHLDDEEYRKNLIQRLLCDGILPRAIRALGAALDTAAGARNA